MARVTGIRREERGKERYLLIRSGVEEVSFGEKDGRSGRSFRWEVVGEEVLGEG